MLILTSYSQFIPQWSLSYRSILRVLPLPPIDQLVLVFDHWSVVAFSDWSISKMPQLDCIPPVHPHPHSHHHHNVDGQKEGQPKMIKRKGSKGWEVRRRTVAKWTKWAKVPRMSVSLLLIGDWSAILPLIPKLSLLSGLGPVGISVLSLISYIAYHFPSGPFSFLSSSLFLIANSLPFLYFSWVFLANFPFQNVPTNSDGGLIDTFAAGKGGRTPQSTGGGTAQGNRPVQRRLFAVAMDQRMEQQNWWAIMNEMTSDKEWRANCSIL